MAFRFKRWVTAGVLAAAVAMTAPAALCAEQAIYPFDLPAQPLAEALRAIARQTGANVLFESKDLNGIQTKALKGQLTIHEAIERALEGTELEAQRTTPTTVIVQRSSSDSSASTVLPGSRPMMRLAQADAAPAWQGEGSREDRDQATAGRLAEQPSIQAQARVELEEIIVTGTHIRGAAPDSSPLTVYTREDIERSGAGSVPEFVRKIPQNFANVDASAYLSEQTTSNFSLGTGINLRGLGAGSTLVLLNGHRLAPAGQGGAFVDVSLLPLSAIERVDVLTDGASAIYGADAVGGVVNFTLRRDFSGLETRFRYGGATRGGLDQFDETLLAGGRWKSGNAMFAYEHADSGGLRVRQRDFVPDQGEPDAQFVPDQVRDSLFATAQHDLSAGAHLFVDGFVSRRRYEMAITPTPGIPLLRVMKGEGKQTGGAAGLRQDLMKGWELSLTANYARGAETRTSHDPINGFRDGGGIHSETRSLELIASGALVALPGGQMRVSVGGGYREEAFDDFVRFQANAGSGHERSIANAFAEVLIPLVGPSNRKPMIDRLELSLAGRYDTYNDIGSSTDPKVGLLWAPTADLRLRGTYASSYRVPTLAQTSDVGRDYIIFPLPLPEGGVANTLLLSALGNSTLSPEESKSYTAGFDFSPRAVPGLAFSATYYRIDYTNRIGGPPVVGSSFDLFFQMETLAPFFDLTPDLAAIQQEIDSGSSTLNDFLNVGVQNADALFDFRLKNLAVNQISGVEFTVAYDFATDVGRWRLSLAGDYVSKFDFRSTPTTASASLVNRTFRPMDLKLRSGATWSRRNLSASLFVSYADSYENNLLNPAGKVDSWTTADLQVSYQFDSAAPAGWLRDTRAALSIQNVADETPPHLEAANSLFYDFGYDVANATPYGRVISLEVSKRW